MWKSLVRICIGVGVILGGLLAFGIGSIFWKSYTIKRNPVYQTTMTDFEICDEFDENITQKLPHRRFVTKHHISFELEISGN